MYLPKSKYNVIAAKPGEFTLNGEQYTGPVIVTFREEYYAGSAPDNVKGQLVKVEGLEQKAREAVAVRRVPTEDEYATGYMVRYFKQDLKTLKIIELLPAEYATYIAKDGTSAMFMECKWILVGKLEDLVTSTGYSYPGVRKRNQETVDRLEQSMRGIGSQVLTDPAEFVVESL